VGFHFLVGRDLFQGINISWLLSGQEFPHLFFKKSEGDVSLHFHESKGSRGERSGKSF
jgi:hypothetical protein